MCGRFTLRTPMTKIVEQFAIEQSLLAELPVRYNVAPTQSVAVIRTGDGKRQLTNMRWGLVPSWAKDTKIAYSTMNARSDTLATKPAFRTAFKKRRCLVIADGYYEWILQGKSKQPILYEIDGGRPFAFAGLWEQWWSPENPEGAPLESCTIVTTNGNELARQVHDRMPVILDEADYAPWLDPAIQDGERLKYLFDPFPADRMSARRVSSLVNNARNEGPECIANSA